MRKLLLAFCVVSAVSAFSQSNSSAQPGDRPSKELMVAYCDAWSTGGPDKAAAFYDKSPDNVFFDIAPLKYKGWAEYEPGVKQMLSTFETAKLTLGDDVAIHPAGNWAWGTSTMTLSGKLKTGNQVSLPARWTAIWLNKGGKWLIVHEHVSVPWGGPESEKRDK
jgi:ketosteroid isomerase-like protein